MEIAVGPGGEVWIVDGERMWEAPSLAEARAVVDRCRRHGLGMDEYLQLAGLAARYAAILQRGMAAGPALGDGTAARVAFTDGSGRPVLPRELLRSVHLPAADGPGQEVPVPPDLDADGVGRWLAGLWESRPDAPAPPPVVPLAAVARALCPDCGASCPRLHVAEPLYHQGRRRVVWRAEAVLHCGWLHVLHEHCDYGDAP